MSSVGGEKFVDWKKAADSLLHRNYALKVIDLGFEDDVLRRIFDTRETPEGFVRWVAAKHGLIHRKDWTLQRAKSLLHSVMK